MIVCICRGASDRDIVRAIEAGAGCLPELARCGAGGECGGCHNALREMIEARGASCSCSCNGNAQVAASAAAALLSGASV